MNRAIDRNPARREPAAGDEAVREPPRGLLGAALLTWGWMIDWVWLGILAAAAVESHRYVDWRWDFSDEDYVRIWNVCVGLFLCLGVFQALDGRFWGMARAFQKWLPVLLAPMQLAQVYGEKRCVPLVTFSLVARRKRELDVRLGRDLRPAWRFHFGHVYFAATIMAIGVERADGEAVFLAAGALVLWALWPLAVPGRGRWGWFGAAGMVAALGYMGQLSMEGLQRYVENRALQWLQQYRPSQFERAVTRMGEVGEVKLSPDIVWRMRVVTGAPPRYLRENVYQRYLVGMWQSPRSGFQDVPLRNARDGSDWEVAPVPEGVEANAVLLRGRIYEVTQVLAVPRETSRFIDLPAGELRRSAAGAFVATVDPGPLEFLAVYGGNVEKARDSPPAAGPDLEAPLEERPGMERALAKLGITEETPAREAVSRVRQWFSSGEFRYSRYLENGGAFRPGGTLVTRFLEETRAGHCEYYASATVLLLRAAGVPARYVVGFAVEEYDKRRKEFVIRGLHAHAWAQAWVDGEWMEVDTTPAQWEREERAAMSRWQGIRDMLARWGIDFGLWRASEEKGIVWSLIPLGIAGVLMGVVIVRFLRGFQKGKRKTPGADGEVEWERNGLDSEWYEAERALASLVPARADGQPLRAWHRATRSLLADLGPRVGKALDLHYRLRFDPAGLEGKERRELAELARAIAEEAAQREPRKEGTGR